ncbi:Putative oxidoreductase OS=Streptomyces griseus subsp. griseus (strain JCM 4626 / NBRC) OX=455632 GN=SGR_212 PE=4 SV=1 [Streptomyces griseus subsp. griseus]
MLGFIAYPVLSVFSYSLQHYNVTKPWRNGFAGLDNFRRVFTEDDQFWPTLAFSAQWVFTQVTLQLLLLGLLLEKPPAAGWADYARMAEGVERAGIACQVGFQSFGSHALPAIRELVATGAIGAVTGFGAAGAWVRDDAYFRRAPWAGRRRIGSTDVVDGVLTNPLAHAVATALELACRGRSEEVTAVETELYRAHAIEADDTSSVRVTTAGGPCVTVAVTLCAERPGEPYVIVHGERGRITFWYKQDRVLVQRAGRGPEETVHGRTDLLENLLDHLAQGTPLLVPPASTGAFMRVVEAVRTAPEPAPLPDRAWETRYDGPGGGPRRVVPGIDSLVAAGAESLSLFSELGAPWARVGQAAAS